MDNPEYVRRIDFDEVQYEQIVTAGIATAKGGDCIQARTLLLKAIEMKPTDTRPWLWLSVTTDDPEEQRDYLEGALAADPGNAAARRGLVLLSEKLDRSRLLQEGEGVEPQASSEPEEAHAAQVFVCPKCGGHTTYNPDQEGLVCASCGYAEEVGDKPAGSTEAAEQLLDFILPTTLGHRWSEAQHRLGCSQCGAVVLLPSGQTASVCPYCGSSQWIESAEKAELVDPQVIAPAKFGEKEAVRRFRNWLGSGWFIPDDLKALAQTSRLRPAYYPFWTFDGTLQMNWTCEVNEGDSRSPHWVVQEGEESQMFDDVLVPGMHKMDKREIARIEPFNLKKLVEFEPEYLAGWTALTYDLALAEASLKAREKVAQDMRRGLYGRVQLGREQRNLRSGGLSWSGMTFKLALLPLWVGTYRYRGKAYRLLLNGQTGKVGGAKPTDTIKVIAFVLSTLATLVFLFFLLWGFAMTFNWLIP